MNRPPSSLNILLSRHTRRREFIALLGSAVATYPCASRAQQPVRPVVGILDSVGERAVAAFRSGLSEMGYVEGSNLTIELRTTDQNNQLPTLATGLVQNRVAVIAAIGGPSAPAAKAATATIPIVFSIGGDPVELGLVKSINQPGGNITGVTFFAAELLQKQLGLLREVVPKARVIGFLVNPDNPRAKTDTSALQAAVSKIGLQTYIASSTDERDLDSAFTSLAQQHVDALIIAGDPFLLRESGAIGILAARHRIPAVFGWGEFAAAGGLMSYGASLIDAHRQAGVYAGRILKGEKPGDLPVMQPTKFEFVLNMKVAKALGLTIPPGILAIADEVIE